MAERNTGIHTKKEGAVAALMHHHSTPNDFRADSPHSDSHAPDKLVVGAHQIATQHQIDESQFRRDHLRSQWCPQAIRKLFPAIALVLAVGVEAVSVLCSVVEVEAFSVAPGKQNHLSPSPGKPKGFLPVCEDSGQALEISTFAAHSCNRDRLETRYQRAASKRHESSKASGTRNSHDLHLHLPPGLVQEWNA